jgi:hypothetical protein
MDAIGKIRALAAASLDLESHVKPALSQGQSVPSEERTGFSHFHISGLECLFFHMHLLS